jgi:acetylornithine deacetylase
MIIDRDFVTRTLVDLVRINSINPTLVPGAPGEAEIAAHVARLLERLGLAVSVHEAAPGRPSVVGVLRGTGGGRRLMLNGHLDTVGIDGMAEPFSGRVENGRVYGRGSQDMKGSLTACFAAVKSLADSGRRLAGDVIVAAVADEEHASIGTADIASRYPVDGAIVTEPTDLQICTAHKGFVWIEVTTHGVAAHGSRFQDGVDANLRMGRFLHELERLERDLRARAPHRLVGPPSLHAATIAGGSGLSTYAATCKLEIERRTIPGETEGQVITEITELADRLARADSSFRATVRSLFARESFEARAGSPLAAAVDHAAAQVLGRIPGRLGKSGWMDSALLAAAGADTLVFGPTGAGLHGAVEWVDLDSVVSAAEVLARTAIEYCG